MDHPLLHLNLPALFPPACEQLEQSGIILRIKLEWNTDLQAVQAEYRSQCQFWQRVFLLKFSLKYFAIIEIGYVKYLYVTEVENGQGFG